MIPIDKRLALAVLALFATWSFFVILSGGGWNPFNVTWNFGNPAAFGDSFGPLSAAMASLAALSAIATYRAQSTELKRARERDIENDKSAAKVIFERTFFQLLDHHRQNVSAIDLDGSGPRRVGQDAFRSMVYYFKNHNAAGLPNAWEKTYLKYENDLGYYFRFLYHMVRYIDQNEIEDKYFYIQILRATLSESELILLAANCSFGEGKSKFKELLESYSLLHNLSEKSRKNYRFEIFFSGQAFNRFQPN